MKIKSLFYKETIKAIAELKPKKKVDNIDNENILYNNIFVNETGNLVFLPYLNQIEKRQYKYLKQEANKKKSGQIYNKKLAKYYEMVTINQYEVQDFFSVKIETQLGSVQTNMAKVTQKEIYISLLKLKCYSLHTSEVQWVEYFNNITAEYIGFRNIWTALNDNIINEETRSYIGNKFI